MFVGSNMQSPSLSLLLLLIISITVTGALSVDTGSGVQQQGEDHNDNRNLQTSGGPVPDLIAPTSMCSTLGGTQFTCDITQRVGSGQDYLHLVSTVVCPLNQLTGFDFRQLTTECACQTLLTPSAGSTVENKTPKYCTCFVCEPGFGPSSISIDCNEPRMVDDGTGGIPDSYIFNTCTSIDCNGNCNGTCSIGCDYSGNQCSFCNPTITDPPTPTPQVQVQPQPQPQPTQGQGQDPNLEPMVPDDSVPSSPDEIPTIGGDTTTAAPTIAPTAAKPTNPLDKIGEFFGGSSAPPPNVKTYCTVIVVTTTMALISALFME